MMRILDHIVEWWMKQCVHPPRQVIADILDGDDNKLQIKQCRRCGAVLIIWDGYPRQHETWRRAQPLWYKHNGDEA